MPRTSQMFEAAALLSQLLGESGIPHAFHGGFLTLALGSQRETEEMYCIVEQGFRRARAALQTSESLKIGFSTWSNRLFVTYNEPIPGVEIEILNAGEEGPRALDRNTTTGIRGIPFLTVTEFLRAKLKSWSSRGSTSDASDIAFVLVHYWQNVDINRVLVDDMHRFVGTYGDNGGVRDAWTKIKTKYGMM